MDAKQYLRDILSYYLYKLDNNLCTMEEIRSVSDAIQENLEVNGTVKDFAKFYDQPEVNVRVAINRKLLAKPKRVVMYPFQKFAKVVSDSWRKKNKE